MLIISGIGIGVLANHLWQSIIIPFKVEEPLEIINYTPELALFPGEITNLEVTVRNHASVNYSVQLDFSLDDTAYQDEFVTFSDKTYIVTPGEQVLTAWVSVEPDAPPIDTELRIELKRVGATIPDDGQDPHISAQYSASVNAHVNYMQIFGQDVSVGETVDHTLSGNINDPLPHYEWVSWAGGIYPNFDGFSIRIETIQQDYVYKIIGMGHVGGSQPFSSGWIQVNSPFQISQLNHIRNRTDSDGSYHRIWVNAETGRIDFEHKSYKHMSLIDAPAFGFAMTIAKPGSTLPPFNDETTRIGASYVYDTSENRVVMFGGATRREGDFRSDVWTFDPLATSWTPISALDAPSPRQHASMSYDTAANNFLIFGGSARYGEVDPETWLFNFSGPATGSWAYVTDIGPSRRRSASLAHDRENDLHVLFGGGEYKSSFNDTWTFDPSTEAWTKQNTSLSPPERLASSMTYDAESGLCVLFGGLNTVDGTLLSDTWFYNATINTWQQVFSATTPGARMYPSLASDDDGHVYLFGGWKIDHNERSRYLDDMWRFDVDTLEWTELYPSYLPQPQSRAALMHLGDGRFVLMGGWRDSPLGDIWFYDASQNVWSTHPIEPNGDTITVYPSDDSHVGKQAHNRQLCNTSDRNFGEKHFLWVTTTIHDDRDS